MGLKELFHEDRLLFPSLHRCQSRWAIRSAALVFMLFTITGCALLDPSYERPEIHLVSIRPLSSEGLEQRFLLGLKVVNPNRRALSVSGMSFKLTLNDAKVLSGVSGGIEPIPAYSETTIDVGVSTNLLGGFRLLSSVIKGGGSVHYVLETKLRSSWWPVPVTISESGDFSINPEHL